MGCRDMFPTYLGVKRVFPLFEIILFLRRASLKKNYTLFQIIIKLAAVTMGEWLIRPFNKGDCLIKLYHSGRALQFCRSRFRNSRTNQIAWLGLQSHKTTLPFWLPAILVPFLLQGRNGIWRTIPKHVIKRHYTTKFSSKKCFALTVIRFKIK